jgi:CHAT domain-containing protein
MRQQAKVSRASKPYIGFGNPLLDGPDERYAQLAKVARDKQRCPEKMWQRVARSFGLRGGLTPRTQRGGLVDIEDVRAQVPLPETADELCTVARALDTPASEIRLGAGATETAVKLLNEKRELAQYRIVHFAAHGALAGQFADDAEPGLILTPPKGGTAEDDGYLSASEIAGLKLDADWVILSACNTAAAGSNKAEALSGLARAFFYAGTRALLVSHWSVYSDSTAKLVTNVLRTMAADKAIGRSEALRRAMLTLIDAGEPNEAHPSYWAPFVVVGEGAH